MPRGNKPTGTDKQMRHARAVENAQEQGSVARPEAKARAWALNQLHGGGKKVASRQKLPFGPLGGSGRKTNRARSS